MTANSLGALQSAAQAQLVSCHRCTWLSPELQPEGRHHQPGDGGVRTTHCLRCGAALHRRKPQSVQRTWALVIGAAVLYIPANIYPVMTIIQFGRGHPDTIMSGIIGLFETGEVPIALLVLFASILVPALKLFGLSFLLISVQKRWSWRPRDRTLLYRLIELVGRWSMLDVFMLATLIALVKIGSLATIDPGIGALSFASVVVLTILASQSFDPRLIWDALEDSP